MATNIVLKRSSSSGAVPGTSDLALGEIALNTYDGKMYMKKTVSGSSSIVELTGNVALSSSAFDLINYKFVATSNQTSFSGSDANSVTLAYASGTIQVFLNGILLDPTDYTATNGTAVVLDTGANSGDILYISRFAGVNPFDDFKYVASSNQTTFTGSDANSETLLYTVGNLAVYLNGVQLDPTDYTATTGTSVVLASGASSGDILHIHEFNQTGLTEVHADSTPTLGGDLDLHTYDLVTTDNRNIDIIPHGTGDVNLSTDTVKIGASGEDVIVTTNGTGDITLSTNAGTNSGLVKILDGANQNIEITPNGSGKINLDGLLWPNADGSANQFIQTDGSGNLSFVDVLDTSEEIQDTVGAMFSSNTETGITATYQDSDGTIDLALVSRTIHGVAYDGSANIDLTEEIQDTVGAMFSSNTETNITVTYQDSDGTIDLVVPNTLSNVTELGTLTHLDVDNLNLNGNTLTSTTSDFIIDASHNIYLDADGGNIVLQDGGTSFGQFIKSAGNLRIYNPISDGDIQILGNDGGSAITAVEFDMSNAGDATFNSNILINDGKKIKVGSSQDLEIYHSGSHSHIHDVGTGNFYLDSNGTGIYLTYNANNENMAQFVANGAVNLYHDNSKKFETTAAGITVTGEVAATSLDISGDVDVDGTLEADAITVNGTTLAETISDTVGAMVTSNTESGITVAYQDADNTLDFTIGTLNQNTTGTAATVTGAAQSSITSLGTLTTLTVDDITINGSTISDGGDLTLDVGGDIFLDAATGYVKLLDGGTEYGRLYESSNRLVIQSMVSDGDLLFSGVDGGSGFTALTLDMSEAGHAIFNSSVNVATHARGTLTTDNDGSFDMNASNNFKCTPSGNFTLTFTNISAQSGNILLINSGGHTVSAHSNTKVDANILGTISTAGTYLLAYFSDGTNVYMTNSAVYT
jgi:cytoskeletal protein CcmA (bactofilin family)